MNVGGAVRSARKAMGLTQAAAAKLGGISRQAVILLEHGGGRMATLERIRKHIQFRVVGLASGNSPGGQVRKARLQRGMTQAQVADRARVSLPTVRAVETGTGSISALSRIIEALAPNARGAALVRQHWQITDDIRYTPPDLLHAVTSIFGPISLDPAGDVRSFVDAERVITEEEDGLRTRWSGRFAFCNPPYSDLSRWMDRCADAWDRREVDLLVGLFPVRTESVVFRKRIYGQADILLLPTRLRFHDVNRDRLNHAPFAVMIVIWGGGRDAVADLAERTGSILIGSKRNEAA
jgi:transcriptional regulator with XRE-family HTH domain